MKILRRQPSFVWLHMQFNQEEISRLAKEHMVENVQQWVDSSAVETLLEIIRSHSA